MRVARIWLTPALVALAVGCASRSPASGEITFTDGTPLAAGQVVFESEALRHGAACVIEPDGTFNIAEPLPVGEYVVYVTDARKAINPAAGLFGPPLVHKKFADPTTSPLRARVGEGFIKLAVEPPGK